MVRMKVRMADTMKADITCKRVSQKAKTNRYCNVITPSQATSEFGIHGLSAFKSAIVSGMRRCLGRSRNSRRVSKRGTVDKAERLEL